MERLVSGLWHSGADLLAVRGVRSALTLAIVFLGPFLAILTFVVIGWNDTVANATLRLVLLTDFVYVLMVAGLVLHRVSSMITARRKESAGSRLHLRLMRVFALVAMIPTILVAVFATLTVNFGLEGWFSDRVRNVVGNSLEAAQAYAAEHRFNLTSDAELLARFLNNQKLRFPRIAPGEFRELLNRGQLQMQRELREAYVIDGAATLKARGERSYLFNYDAPPRSAIERARDGETVVIEDRVKDEFRALVALPAFADRYLYVTRHVDGEILDLLDETKETVGLYQQLERDRGKMLFEFALLYIGFALILILASIWLGLWFAERLARPVGLLAGAAQRVGAGDLDVQVAEQKGDDEIAMLSRVFNRMTKQVKGQRDALIRVNEETERARRVIDSILAGVSAGVIGLDAAGDITLMNATAMDMLDFDGYAPGPAFVGQEVPEFATLFEELRANPHTDVEAEIRLNRHGHEQVLLVRMVSRFGENGRPEGYVVTFDDISDLVSAQRMAAWGDVARRIAHEIKNPLTPIQLSAERLRRKLGPILGPHDAETPNKSREALDQQTDIIIRQTDGLRRIVDEFSKFARMPTPERHATDLLEVLRSDVLLQKSARQDIQFTLALPSHPVTASIDENLMSQAFTNLMKNAGEAIDERLTKDSGFNPQIRVSVTDADGAVLIQIQDNGIGLPAQRSRLFEPYVTHREKGTGLGLSIVKKIIEEHDGQLDLIDAPPFENGASSGAEARIILPREIAEPVQAAE